MTSRLVRGAFLAAAVWIASAGAQPVASDALNPERVLRSFDLIVFRSEYSPDVQQHLRRWAGPVRIFLDLRAGSKSLIDRLVRAHMADLAEMTGLDMTIVERPADANLHAVFEREEFLDRVAGELFEDPAEIKRILRQSVCIGRYFSNARYEIVRAIVVIPIDRAASRGLLPACVVEEFTQVMGLPNDSAEVFPSIFNDRSVDTALTELDRRLITLLYDRALRPGMTRAATLEAARQMLEKQE